MPGSVRMPRHQSSRICLASILSLLHHSGLMSGASSIAFTGDK